MTRLSTYLLFNGSCERAMEFYRSCFGGELTLTKVGDSPFEDQMPAAMHGRVLNARLKSVSVDISASDWLRTDARPVQGNTVCLYLSGGAHEELKTFFNRLSEGADVTDPLKEMFFGTYGALNDGSGVRWMFKGDNRV
jgi:PhnB protein